jgi:hypothetical protein
MNWHPKYCSYIPLLLTAMKHVGGDVLELGTGPISTRLLHWVCLEQGRKLVSYENSGRYFEMAKACESPWHEVKFAENWDGIDIARPWGIALVDHGPPERRVIEARRLANHAQVILLHDTQWQQEKHYGYRAMFPEFRYRYTYNKHRPHTTAVSNFVDVSTW